MKTYIFNNIKVEYRNCPCCKGMNPPAGQTYTDPIKIRTGDMCDPKTVIEAYMGDDATIIDFDCEIVNS